MLYSWRASSFCSIGPEIIERDVSNGKVYAQNREWQPFGFRLPVHRSSMQLLLTARRWAGQRQFQSLSQGCCLI
jgi:hypothetical protein